MYAASNLRRDRYTKSEQEIEDQEVVIGTAPNFQSVAHADIANHEEDYIGLNIIELKRQHKLKDFSIRLQRIEDADKIKLKGGDARVSITISDSDLSDSDSPDVDRDDDDEDKETRAEFERLYTSNEFTISLEVAPNSPPRKTVICSTEKPTRKCRLPVQKSTAKCQARKRNTGDSSSNSANSSTKSLDPDCDSDSEPGIDSETESDEPSSKSPKKPKIQPVLKYPCDSCKKVCSSLDLLDQHQNIHKGLRPFSCTEPKCTHACATAAGLQTHKQRCHGVRRFQCEACGKLFHDITAYKKHGLAHKIQRLNRQSADEVTVGDRDRDKVDESDGDLSELKCDMCSKYFVSRYALRKHKEGSTCNEEGQPSFKCEQCCKTYTSETHFKEHKRTHDDSYVKENLSCPTCHKTFISKRNLKSHEIAVHTKEFKFKCEFENCNFGTNKRPRLKIHMDHVHCDARPFKCDNCTKSFKSSESLKLHDRQVHPVSKDHICAICGMALATKATLKQHEARHNDPNRAGNEFFFGRCQLCGAVFSKEKDLQLHQIGHSGDRGDSGDRDSTFETPNENDNEPFHCYYCNESFASRSTLQLHQRRIHFEKFEFQCEQCNYGAPSSSTMEQHRITSHATARPFKCLVCESKFRTQPDLNKHTKSTHPVSKDHICSKCRKAFSRKSKLSEHEFKAHKKQYPKKASKRSSVIVIVTGSTVTSNKEVGWTATGDVNQFRCELCQQNFLHATNFEKHCLKIHGSIRSGDGDGDGDDDQLEYDGYKCEHCPSKFTVKRNLASHMKSHDENYVRNFLTCQTCKRVYSSEQGLRRHKDKDKCHTGTSPL